MPLNASSSSSDDFDYRVSRIFMNSYVSLFIPLGFFQMRQISILTFWQNYVTFIFEKLI